MNRRQFISRSAAVLAAGSIANQQLLAGTTAKQNKGRIGIQLYSIRNDLPKDFVGSLKKLSDIGYSLVEPYGFSGGTFLNHTMKSLSVLVKDLGMSISGSHVSGRILPENTNAPEWDAWKKTADELKSGGGTWVIQASFPGNIKGATMDVLKRAVEHFNRAGEICKKAGVKYAYHNHDAEMGKVDGVVILDYLIKNTDPKLVSFQLDLGHVVNGGGDCVHYLSNYPERIPLWHASDFDATTRKYTDVGKGSVPYKTLFDLPKSGGLKQLTVEQETEGDIFASCKADFDYLKQFKWTQVL